MESAFKAGGRNAAVKYCQDWKGEVDNEGKNLSAQLKTGAIDMKTYNQKRLALNQHTNELNLCVSAMNKKFNEA
jgi:hypothetical protein